MSTYVVKMGEIERQWILIDATGQTLGRLASQIAKILKGKDKAIYSPHLDTGDHVIVVNAAKVSVTGKKLKQKSYIHHSGYPGGLKSDTLENLLSRDPTKVIELAVKGMLPHNALGKAMLRKLKVYEGDSHPHQAQLPMADS